MKLIFVSGPYRANTEFGVIQNIRKAEQLAIEIWMLGHACLCPHKNTAHLGGIADDNLWIDGAVEMVRRCDAVVCVPGWENSEGARREVLEAKRAGVFVFEDIEGLKEWLYLSSAVP